MDLQPDTDYECKFVISDPDGVHGAAKGESSLDQKIVNVRTRPEPKPVEGGRIYHVYP